MHKRVKRYLVAGVGLGLTLGLWFLLAPRQLGGSVSYTVITGSSMEPGLHFDDLAIVRERGHYLPGDIVAYKSRHLGTIVIHRIVRQENGRYVLKGDDNDWLDSDRPRESEVIGKLWIRLPGAGRYLLRLQEPRTAALLVGILTLLALGLGGEKKPRVRSPAPSGRSPDPHARGIHPEHT